MTNAVENGKRLIDAVERERKPGKKNEALNQLLAASNTKL
jgi:hypothetical protein